MTSYDAIVLRLDNNIEEQVLLDIKGHQITCFASVCPYPIKISGRYRIALYLFVADEFNPVEVQEDTYPAIIQEANNFKYTLVGKLIGNIFDCGIKIEDDVFVEQYGDLNGKMIKVSVDRIDVEFL